MCAALSLLATAQATQSQPTAARELDQRRARAAAAMATRTGPAAERAAQALRDCVTSAARRCQGPPPVDPVLVACFVNGLYDLARHPFGRRALAEQAFPLVAEVRTAAEGLPNPSDRRYVLTQAALIAAELHRARSRVTDAADALTDALRPEVVDPRLRPFLLVMLADLRRMAGAFDEAERSCVAAETAVTAATPDGTAVLLALQAVRARWCVDLGLPDLALQRLPQVRALADRIGTDAARVEAALVAADVLMAANRTDELIRELGPWLAADAPTGPWQGVVRGRLGAALALIELGTPAGRRLDTSAPDPVAVLTGALAAPDLPEVERVGAQLHLARVALHRGALDQATRHAELAQQLLPDGPDQAAPSLQHGTLALVHCRIARVGRAPRSERRAALVELEHTWRRLLVEWARAPLRPGGVGFLQQAHRRELLGELIHACRDVEGDAAGVARAFDHVLAAQALTSAARAGGAVQPTLAQVRAAVLAPGGGALVFVPALDTTHVFVLDATTLEHQLVAPPNGLEPWRSELQVELLRATGGGPDDPTALLAAGRGVAAVLLPEPLRARLRTWPALAIAGADALGRFPIEALPWSDAELLGEARAVYHLPSLALVGQLAGSAPDAQRSAVLLLAPQPPAGSPAVGLPPLSLSPAERTRLAAPFHLPAVGAGTEATAAWLARSLAPGVGLLEILAHGVFDPRRELPVGLALAALGNDDGVLWPEHVTALPCVPPLVVLAACRAGSGPRRIGDDPLLHLGGAFLARGSRCVIAPTLDIELGATVELLTTFHQRLAAGDPPAEALRAARARLHAAQDGARRRFTCLLQALGLAHLPSGAR